MYSVNTEITFSSKRQWVPRRAPPPNLVFFFGGGEGAKKYPFSSNFWRSLRHCDRSSGCINPTTLIFQCPKVQHLLRCFPSLMTLKCIRPTSSTSSSYVSTQFYLSATIQRSLSVVCRKVFYHSHAHCKQKKPILSDDKKVILASITSPKRQCDAE